MKAMLNNYTYDQYTPIRTEDSSVWGGDLDRGAWALYTQGLYSARILEGLTTQVLIQGECPGESMLFVGINLSRRGGLARG